MNMDHWPSYCSESIKKTEEEKNLPSKRNVTEDCHFHKFTLRKIYRTSIFYAYIKLFILPLHKWSKNLAFWFYSYLIKNALQQRKSSSCLLMHTAQQFPRVSCQAYSMVQILADGLCRPDPTFLQVLSMAWAEWFSPSAHLFCGICQSL